MNDEKELTNKVINSIHTNHVNRSIFAIGQGVQGKQNTRKPNQTWNITMVSTKGNSNEEQKGINKW